MHANEIVLKAADGKRLCLRAEPGVLRSFLTLVERGLDIRVVPEDPPARPTLPPALLSTSSGFLCDQCQSAWRSKVALGVHRAKAHRARPVPALPGVGRP